MMQDVIMPDIEQKIFKYLVQRDLLFPQMYPVQPSEELLISG